MHARNFISVAALCAAGVLNARTITVDAKGGADFSSIDSAMEAAAPGDVVSVAPGVYREEVRVRRSGTEKNPIVVESAVRGAAVVRGSEVWKNAWNPLENHPGVLSSPIDLSQFVEGRVNPYSRTISLGSRDSSRPARSATNVTDDVDAFFPRTLGQIFIDSRPVSEVVTQRALFDSPNTWMVSPDGSSVWLHPSAGDLPIERRVVEWTVRDRLFHAARRRLAHIVVRGFVFEHCANQGPFPQKGAVDMRSGYGWIVEHNTIRFAKTVGLGAGGETWDAGVLTDVPQSDRVITSARACHVRFNHITDNGVSGIAAWCPGGLRIYNNVIERNNTGCYGWRERYWDETAGVKVHGGNVTVANNVIRDNEGHGLWFDTGFVNVRIAGNAILNNRRSGIMFESAFGSALVDCNVIAYTRSDGNSYYGGDGIYSHNGCGVVAAHNLFAQNAGAGVRFRTTWGKIGNRVYETSNNRYLNNIFYQNSAGGLMVSATNKLSRGTISEGNLFLENSYLKNEPPYPFRFANYNVGPGKGVFSNIWERVNSADPAGAMPFAPWRALSQPTTIDAWRTVQGLDKTSLAARGGLVNVITRDMLLTIQIPKDAMSFRAKGLAEIDYDFRGAPYPGWGAVVQPGPIVGVEWDEKGRQFSLNPFERPQPPPIRMPLGPNSAFTSWMKGKTGAFMHYLYSEKGAAEIDKFDVPGVVRQLVEMKADYFCLTLGQNSGWYLAPNDLYEDIAGYPRSTRCSARDVPAEFIKALKPHGIKFMLYLPCQTPNRDTAAIERFGFGSSVRYGDCRLTPEGVRKWASVIEWWSRRYGEGVAGWWFDGAYEWLGFDEGVARIYAAAAKAGNTKAIVAFNGGVRRRTLPLGSDYMAGEENDPLDFVCSSSRNEDMLQWQVLTFLGDRWGRANCRHPDEKWLPWLSAAYANGGAVTFDMGHDMPSGLFSSEQVAQFKRLKEQIQQASPGQPKKP
jgi:hypothetical protein